MLAGRMAQRRSASSMAHRGLCALAAGEALAALLDCEMGQRDGLVGAAVGNVRVAV